MKNQNVLCLIAGIILACAVSTIFTPVAQAFKVAKVENSAVVRPVDPIGCVSFLRWNLNRFPSRKIPYQINSSGSDDLSFTQVRQGIKEAFSMWKGVPGAPLDFEAKGFTPVKGFIEDGQNVLFWDESGDILKLAGFPGVIALTIARADATTGEITEADIGFNGSTVSGLLCPSSLRSQVPIKWSLSEQGCGGVLRPLFTAKLQNAGAHEVGHFLGLEHTPAKGALMFATPVKGRVPEILAPDDIAGAQFLYSTAPASGWAGISPFVTDPLGDGPFDVFGRYRAGLDVVSISVTNDERNVYFLIEFAGPPSSEAGGMSLLLDTDLDTSTGCVGFLGHGPDYEINFAQVQGGNPFPNFSDFTDCRTDRRL